jgi:DNA-directed RNA polymerase specialized sigma24 family protein
MVVITARKAIDLRIHEKRKKRGGGRVKGESVLNSLLGDKEAGGLEAVVGREPTPELAAQVADEYQRLLAKLPNVEMRVIAQRKLEGYTNAEIAARLGCGQATVERRLGEIRKVWQEELGD